MQKKRNLARWWAGLTASLLLAVILGGATRPDVMAQTTATTADSAVPPGAYLTEFAV